MRTELTVPCEDPTTDRGQASQSSWGQLKVSSDIVIAGGIQGGSGPPVVSELSTRRGVTAVVSDRWWSVTEGTPQQAIRVG